MSIRDRVCEAEMLWNSGRKEGAWIQAMIATAATARKRYPRPMRDSDSFKSYIRDVCFTIVSGNPHPQGGRVLFQFGDRAFEDILYEDFRCSWIHEGKLDGIGLTETRQVSEDQVIQTLVVGQFSQLPDHWVLNLLNAIRSSPENSDEFL